MQWYLKVLKNYVGFQGRARRTEYWMFVLFHTIIMFILSLIQHFADLSTLLTGVYAIAVLLPALAVAVRRLHDIGRSGWWYLLIFIPIIGAVILIIFYCIDSQEEDNQYGPNPKYIS